MSIGKKAGTGFLSLLYRGILEKLMGLVAMFILARQLSPYDFGLVSITEVLLSIISVFGTTGLSEFLLAYRKDNIEEIFKSSVWFTLIISTCVVCLFLLILPAWAAYQHDTRIFNIGIISGLIFLASQLQAVPKAWFSRHLMFDSLVRIQAPFIIMIPAAKILAVFMGFGVYSLVVPTLIFHPILTIILYRYAKLSPGSKLYTKHWREIFHFTKHLIGSTVLARMADQGDKFILAKFLGLDKLGVYNIAVQMADLFVSQLIMFSNNVLSSVLPKYVDDNSRFYKHYSGFIKTFAFVIFPVIAIMLLIAKPIVLILYGPKWIDAVLPMQILLVYSAIRAVTSSYGPVMNSYHLNKKSFIVAVVYTPVYLAGSVIGSFFGVAGVATSVLVVKSAFVNWNVQQMMAAMSRPLVDWYRNLAPYFIVCAALAMIYATLIDIIPGTLQVSGMALAIAVALVFLLSYLLLFRYFFRKELIMVSAFLQPTFPRIQSYFNTVFRL